MKRLKVGQTVKIVDYLRAMRTCINRDQGDSVLYGAGGCVLPPGILKQPATVAILGARGRRRVCIEWNIPGRSEVVSTPSMWIDTDNLS